MNQKWIGGVIGRGKRDSSLLSSSWVLLCVSVWGVSVFNGLTISCMKWNWHFYSGGKDSDCLLVINQRRNWLGGTGFFLLSFLSFSHTFSFCVLLSCVISTLLCISVYISIFKHFPLFWKVHPLFYLHWSMSSLPLFFFHSPGLPFLHHFLPNYPTVFVITPVFCFRSLFSAFCLSSLTQLSLCNCHFFSLDSTLPFFSIPSSPLNWTQYHCRVLTSGFCSGNCWRTTTLWRDRWLTTPRVSLFSSPSR